MGKSKTTKDLVIYLIPQIFHFLIPIISLPIFTRWIIPAEYGLVDMFQVVMIVGLGFGNWGLQNAYDRFFFQYAPDSEKQNRLMSTILSFTIICLGIIFLLCAIFSKKLSIVITKSPDWWSLCLIVLATGFLNYLNTFFLYQCRNEGRSVFYSIMDLQRLILGTTFSILLVTYFRIGVTGLALGLLIVQVITFIVFIFILKPRIFVQFDKKIFIENFQFGWPLNTKVFLNILNIAIDKYMVGAIASLSVLGIYSRAQTIAYGVFMIMNNIQNVYGPRWNKVLFGQDKSRSLGSLFTDYVSITILPAAVLVTFAPEIVKIFLSSEYQNATFLIIVLSFYYIILAFGKMQGSVASYLKLSGFMAIVTLVSYPLNIGLNFLMIPKYGAVGAVINTLVIGIGTMIVYEIACRKYLKTGYEAGKLILLYGAVLSCAVVTSLSLLVNFSWIWVGFRIIVFAIFIFVWIRIFGLKRICSFLTQFKQ